MTSERYVLKHFYYGQFVRDGKPAGDMRLLAKTHGLTDETIKEALKVALLPPMPGNNEGSWAIVRGSTSALPFVLVESERGKDGQMMLHYIVLPMELVRLLGGNLRKLHPFIAGEMPAYDKVGNIINPLVLSEIEPPDEGQEVDDILDFMMFAKNRMDTIETLLTAIVKNIPLVIVNPPEDTIEREAFVTGLLTLLPPSVRFAVTFATHTKPSTDISVQVRFLSDGDPPEDAIVYDWKTGKATGSDGTDAYSRFIVSQLRLDVELTVRQTRALTGIANWRMRQTSTRLADALAYASQRASVDDAVRNRQPVEAAEVSRILANDPTLSDDLRVEYARHLMTFSMALGELENAKPLGVMLGGNMELADTAYDMLQQALKNGAAGDIFDLLVGWLRSPSGPTGHRWVDMAHECAKIYLNDVIDDGDLDEVELFLSDVDKAGGAVVADRLVPELLQLAMPVAVMNTKLARTSFFLGCKYDDPTQLFEMLSNKAFLEHMPTETRKFVRAVAGGSQAERLLLAAAGAFDQAQRLIMVRFVEIAMGRRLYGMVDTAVLRQLIKVALADWGNQYVTLLNQVVNTLLSPEVFATRTDDDGQHLLSILLAMGQYEDMTRRMLDQSRTRYIGERQGEFAHMVGQVFSETPIPKDEIPVALKALNDGGIRSLPLVEAYIGTLDSHDPSDISNAIAD
ncbi:MAG: hypothetical protein AAF125_04435, partial [Chloroflexota bacterium]